MVVEQLHFYPSSGRRTSTSLLSNVFDTHRSTLTTRSARLGKDFAGSVASVGFFVGCPNNIAMWSGKTKHRI